jgi:hypothetical protein
MRKGTKKAIKEYGLARGWPGLRGKRRLWGSETQGCIHLHKHQLLGAWLSLTDFRVTHKSCCYQVTGAVTCGLYKDT